MEPLVDAPIPPFDWPRIAQSSGTNNSIYTIFRKWSVFANLVTKIICFTHHIKILVLKFVLLVKNEILKCSQNLYCKFLANANKFIA